MNSTRQIHFRDKRPPNEIVYGLEQRIKVVFTPENDAAMLVYRAVAIVVGMPYRLVLRFEGALPEENCYHLSIEVDLSTASAVNLDYFRKSSESWFDYWTKDFKPAAPPLPGEGSNERYRAECERAIAADANLNDVPAVQQALLDAMRNDGMILSTAHKEGGTVIRWHAGRFVSADYGESDASQTFTTDDAFLAYVRQYFNWAITSAAPKDTQTELQAWTLLYRTLHKG